MEALYVVTETRYRIFTKLGMKKLAQFGAFVFCGVKLEVLQNLWRSVYYFTEAFGDWNLPSLLEQPCHP